MGDGRLIIMLASLFSIPRIGSVCFGSVWFDFDKEVMTSPT